MIEIMNDTIPRSADEIFNYAQSHGFGELHCKIDPATGMKAIIAIHNTKLGPALGGCRFIEYPDTASALYDAMRLARGMSYKSACVNLPLGGGKAVIIKPKGNYDRTAYFHAFGQFVSELNGRYITALDSGTILSDMDIIAEHTPHVASLSSYDGDPSPFTAHGIFRGIEAAVLFKLKKSTLDGVHVAIQGLGHVGFLLCQYLHEAGARLSVADINPERVMTACRQFNATHIPSDQIHKISCDVFSPCALGGIINDQTLHQFQTPIIAGAANNQLGHSYHGQKLHEKGILYAPDYVINAGGLIYAASKYLHLADEKAQTQILGIGETLTAIFDRAATERRPTSDIADQIARERLA